MQPASGARGIFSDREIFDEDDAQSPACFQMMQICGAGPYDQHIMLGEHELTDHSQSLAALGIFPGSLLTLKVSFAEHRAL